MNVWRGYSATNLKSLNAEMARVTRKSVKMLDFTAAPSTAQFGSNFDAATKSSG